MVQARVPARDGQGAQVPLDAPGRTRRCGPHQARRRACSLIGLIPTFLALGFGDSVCFAGPPASGPSPACSPDTANVRVAPAEPATHREPRPILTVASTTLLGGYRRFIGSQDVPACRFAPSCSGFMQEAVEQGGFFRGVLLGADRITRCHSWSSPQVPAGETARRADGAIQDPVAWYLQPASSAVAESERGRPVTAAFLSAVLPGAGKAYCGRGADGLQSLLIVGTAALLASRGFDRDGRRSLEGWGAAGVGAVFYAGGIAGAVASADLRGGRDAGRHPRVLAMRAGIGTDTAPAGAGFLRVPDDSVRAQPSLGHGTMRHGISPATAILCSSIVPGSGQMLAGSPGRGLNALVLSAGLGLGVGVLAHDRRYVEAALLFSLGFLRYYHGNLYWAARLAAERSGPPEADREHER